ncbi:MAG: bifunctional adenosylcobinamide kinase/adenosylcobinamide-phosphate guanylyltransferase, partial [Agathobacter sp.]|nr:bifunctional adenosylcobinamide kinase/adenosylcobinamide-phosphate guanylyltransferase [Agathobacter sp.]
GIVPLDSFEREYRERLGRLLCEIAAKAERVERIVCGIGQRIK